MYEVSATTTRALYDDYVEGAQGALLLAASIGPLSDAARNALEKSAEALGLGARACTYLTLKPASAPEETTLGPQDVMSIVEGFDPLALVIADEKAAKTFGQAYRIGLTPDMPARIFGRNAVVFRNLDELLQTNAGKQRAWALLKTLA